ncbi:hypothetical protein ACJIZ3_003805 [Penstemon smallii]|uniref:5'-3' DNA helicase ZGRF1-like N-terminal domain-containing protein n=1 Tax=Penstemon smallii TaxID=265156 RepID=A0ABD3S0D7_9LAMI
MGDAQRWSVTYTKHVKQKRKVYQDGYLQLQSSCQKVVLYDEYDTLLDSRFVKKDEVIKSGETLAFDSYLVDIADQCRGHEPVSTLIFQEKDKKVAGTGSLYSHESRNSSNSVDRKPTFGKNRIRAINLSPSQKIIRDFKKSEMNKYGSSPSCLDMTRSTTEWQVLYTTQITQKKKKFHDGFLQLVVRGSQGRQVMLYDTTRRLLDSKFLKKDELVIPGETLALEGHIVDIGEHEGDIKPAINLNHQGRNCAVPGKTDRANDQAKIPSNNNDPAASLLFSASAEWDAMYTTQVTQKAKKYNNAILKLASSGSYRMQVTLLAEDGTTLGRRFLKLSENVRTGTTLELPGYLVEVGQSRDYDSSVKDSKVKTSSIDDILLSKRVSRTMPFCNISGSNVSQGKPQNKTSPRKLANLNDSSFTKEDTKLSMRTPANEPRRAAHDILSILRKPMIQGNVVPMNKPLVEELPESHSSDIKNHIKEYVQDCNGSAQEELNDKTLVHDCSIRIIKSEAFEVLIDAEEYTGSEHKRELQAKSSSFCHRSGGSNCKKPVINDELTEYSNLMFSSSNEEPHKLFGPPLNSEGQKSIAPALLNIQNINVKLENTREISSHKETKTETTAAVTIDLSSSKFPKLRDDNKGSGSICREGAPSVGAIASNYCTSHDNSDVEEKTLKQDFHVDECPSFDLGF